jgi:osmotically-inducible protein OsmY
MKRGITVGIGSSLLVLLLAGCSSPSERPVYGAASDPNQVISAGGYANPTTPSQPPPPIYSAPPPTIGANASPVPIGSDARLTDRVNQALRSSSLGISPNNITVSSQNGTVTLNGTVPNERQRQIIDDLVRNTTGVVNVNDQLQLSSALSSVYPPSQANSGYPPPAPGQPYAPTASSTGDIFNLHVQGLNDADRTLAQRILQGLRTDSRLETLLPTVDIHVAQGRVVLQGVVQNDQQRSAIESIVRQAAGGSNVEDQIQVQNSSAPVPQ